MPTPNETEYPSLTPSAVQIRWKVPTEFPFCPTIASKTALDDYVAALTFGGIFARNNYGRSLVVHRQRTDDGFVVLTRFDNNPIKDWAVAHVSVQGDRFRHRSEYSFFTLQGALKHYCEIAGESFTETMDELVG